MRPNGFDFQRRTTLDARIKLAMNSVLVWCLSVYVQRTDRFDVSVILSFRNVVVELDKINNLTHLNATFHAKFKFYRAINLIRKSNGNSTPIR